LTKEIIVHNEHQKEIFMASHLVKRGVFEEIEDGENDLKLFTEIQSMLAQPKSQPGFGNPAAIGLGAFGATTILLQLHNLGIVGTGIVMWLAFIFGGLAQFIAGLQEFRTGNNFGSAAFVTYGAFWISLGGIFLSMQMGLIHLLHRFIKAERRYGVGIPDSPNRLYSTGYWSPGSQCSSFQ
jgi:hypothetical protein